MKKITKIIFICLLATNFIACEKDDDTTVNTGDILISSMITNPDGQSGSAFMQIINDLNKEAHYDNKMAYQVPFSGPINKLGNNIFILPGWGEETNMLQKYSLQNGGLVKKGELLMHEQSGATNIVQKGDIAYISCSLSGKVVVINHKTMTQITEIDLSSYGVGDKNPDPSCMLIRDDMLYVALNQMVGGYYPAPERSYVDILIINTKDNSVVKMITEKTSNMSQPTRPADPNSIFMDENKDIYIVCIAGFGALPGHKAGILRIKAGETEFDESYKFIFNETNIQGEPNNTTLSWYVKYAGDGKLFATLQIPAYHNNPPSFIKDKTVISAEINIKDQTIRKLDLPYSNSYGCIVGLYNKQIAFGLSTSTANGFYLYNPNTQEVTDNAVVTTEGYPGAFKWFGDNQYVYK